MCARSKLIGFPKKAIAWCLFHSFSAFAVWTVCVAYYFNEKVSAALLCSTTANSHLMMCRTSQRPTWLDELTVRFVCQKRRFCERRANSIC
jgi:hypothetical protein